MGKKYSNKGLLGYTTHSPGSSVMQAYLFKITTGVVSL